MSIEARIETAVKALHGGKPVIVLDDSSRENEGDLIYPAECITPEIMNLMIRNGTGIVCLSLTQDYIERLKLPMMVECNTSKNKTAFTVSIEAKKGVSTGVSAQDRVKTVLTAVADDASPEDLARPGHIFPLRAANHGVLRRAGHTEAAVDLMKIAGFKTAAVICELMNPDGSMAKTPDIEKFAALHKLPMLTVEDLIHYRLRHEILVHEVASSRIKLEQRGEFEIKIFQDQISASEHTALIKPWKENETPLVRIHSSCLTGDVFGSLHCDCGKQLEHALDEIGKRGGVLLYLNQEGRGIGLTNKIKAYALQAEGRDTVEANLELGLPEDSREYYFAAHILKALGIDKVRLLTNNPRKLAELAYYGIKEVLREPTPTFSNTHNVHYLKTKNLKLGHLIANL